jgi:hypothetical protein
MMEAYQQTRSTHWDIVAQKHDYGRGLGKGITNESLKVIAFLAIRINVSLKSDAA